MARGAAIAVPLNAEGATKPDTAPMSTTRRKANTFMLESYGYRYRLRVVVGGGAIDEGWAKG